jgi:hypothetical protein
MDHPIIEITREEMIKDFCDITKSERNKFLEDTVDTLLHTPELFLKTKYHSEPKGYTAFDIKDPYLSYINILCIVFISNLVNKAANDSRIDFAITGEMLKINARQKPKNKDQTIATIVDIYKELRGLDRVESQAKLASIVQKFLESKY